MNATEVLKTEGVSTETAIDGTGGVAPVDLATAPAKVIAREAKRLTAAAHEGMLRLHEFTEALDATGRAELVPYVEEEIEAADLWRESSKADDMVKHNEGIPKSIVEAFETVSDYFNE